MKIFSSRTSIRKFRKNMILAVITLITVGSISGCAFPPATTAFILSMFTSTRTSTVSSQVVEDIDSSQSDSTSASAVTQNRVDIAPSQSDSTSASAVTQNRVDIAPSQSDSTSASAVTQNRVDIAPSQSDSTSASATQNRVDIAPSQSDSTSASATQNRVDISPSQSDSTTAPTQAQIYPTYYVVNCKESITLRTAPTTSASEICQIPLGAAVSYITTAENGFYQIIYNGFTGYSLASYLSTSPQTTQLITNEQVVTQEHVENYSIYYVANCNQSITLRTSPSTSASEICQIPLGAAVEFIYSAENSFYKVAYNGYTGYVLAAYLAPDSFETYAVCQVVNCNESITLRVSPSTSSNEICQMPLGCYLNFIQDMGNGFYEVKYMDMYGYALASYLDFV